MPVGDLAWGVLLLPLIAAACIALFGLRRPTLAATLSVGAAGCVAVLTTSVFLSVPWIEQWQSGLDWLAVGKMTFQLGLRFDSLSVPMGLVVAWVAFIIHVYSLGYMRGDPGFGRYFAGLSLFLFAMLMIVVATNFLQLFIGWELVGVSSYLLIGFWYQRASAADACKKAFLVNRLGDFGFLLGVLMIWGITGTLDFAELEQRVRSNPTLLGASATLIGLLIFCGVLGKSAQFPLHVWLPDAMEGPTPVSALIHAATMVAAGVYLLCRVFFLLSVPGSNALAVIAWLGAFTALLGAVIATQQDDIKRVLAYSTLSQLGYMVMAVGASSVGHPPESAMYHLSTHAFIKALLFLGAGSVITVLHHEQNIWRMGGLAKKMPITFVTFVVASLALAGIPPLSGFFSKEAILVTVFESQMATRTALFTLAVAVTAFTGFYIARLACVVFLGPERTRTASDARESKAILTLPLLVLAVPSALAGFWGIDSVYGRYFKEIAGERSAEATAYLAGGTGHASMVTVCSIGAAIAGLTIGFLIYRAAAYDPLPEKLGILCRWLRNKLYFDELYTWINAWTHERLAWFADGIDRLLIGGAIVRGIHGSIDLIGRLLRLTQTGNLQMHLALLSAGIAFLMLVVLWH